MSFYGFRQNNTGGSFVFDAARGISVEVWIEAVSKDMAVTRAEEIGLYWYGCDDGTDCECCGDRWSSTYVDEQPTAPELASSSWAKYDAPGIAEGYIHYMDGRCEPLPYKDTR